ncbi:hypothetical protein [Streptomyces decoyicus]|uniref:hypothetical protein n=1 Tax=Streptomyces decoyicus TaxID=249567 RepID=UPI00364F1AAA
MAVAEAVARRTWQTLTDALDNPDDVRGFRRHEAQRDQLRQQKPKQEEEQRELEIGEAREHWVAQQASAEAAKEPAPVCQKCDGPLESSRFEYDPREEQAPPADGVHCAGCRIQLAGPTSRFGRVIRRLVNGDE